MSRQELFQKMQKISAASDQKRSDSYAQGAISRVADSDSNEYVLNRPIPGLNSASTKIPKMHPKGGVEDGNIYGYIAKGNVISVNPETGSFINVGEVDMLKESEEDFEEDEDEELVEEYLEEPEPAPQTTEHTELLRLLADKVLNTPEPVEEDPKKKNKKRVVIKGDNGKFTGKYLDIVVEGDLVVLVRDIDDPVYSPPKGSKVDLLCDGATKTVYYDDIEFELDTYEIGVQVFKIAADK